MVARQSFRPTPGDRGKQHEVSTDGFPDTVSIDLDAKDPTDFTIVEVDDTPEADRGRPTDVKDLAPDDGTEPQSKSGYQKRIDRLKAETNTERRAREAAERREEAALEIARQQKVEFDELRARSTTTTTALADSMKAEREARLADAERRLAQAHTDGDSAAIAKATNDMSLANAELVQIAARAPARPATAAAPAATAQPATGQPPRLAPAAEAWINHNRSWFQKPGNEAKTSKAMSLHWELDSRGIKPTDLRYTREIDKGLKAVYPEHEAYDLPDEGDPGGGQPTPRRTNVVAEGSRANEGRQPSNPRTVELTKSELAVARSLGLTSKEQLVLYAREKQKREMNKSGAA